MKRRRRSSNRQIMPAAIGRRLKQLRQAYGWRQVHISERTGISAPSWNKYETGRSRISVEHASLVVCETGATLDWIYLGAKVALPPPLLKRLNELKNNCGDD